MFNRDRILALDIGASKVVLAEFKTAKTGAPELINYGVEPLGISPENESDATPYIVSALRELMRSRGIKPAPVLMTVSGQAVFPRYVKLPPVARDKILQIISYEAEENVPFPIDEVVWDYQLIAGSDEGDLNVMLVAVKKDRVTALTDCVQAADLEPEIVDVAPMALYNTVRYNYPGLTGCTMILDIGARCSNVIFVEESRIFSRSIPVAGNAMTQEIAKEFDVPFADAEALKQEHAFVALGGVYAGAEDDTADRISKIIRGVVTRLHAEVNRSINFYRSQQGGNPPSLVLLTGGSSIIPHTDTFFREKLKVTVEYLNPFENITVHPAIDADQVGALAHLLGEVSGLALRRSLICPVEINLMPPHIVARKVFRKRQPFFAMAAIGLVFVLLCWWGFFHRMRRAVTQKKATVEQRLNLLRTRWGELEEVARQRQAAQGRAEHLLGIVSLRTRWLDLVAAIHGCMVDGMWLTSLKPEVGQDGRTVAAIRITGRAFRDKVREMAEIEAFRDRLRASPYFAATDETKIDFLKGLTAQDYAQEFTLILKLVEPIELK